MPIFNTAAQAYVGTIELDDVEIELDVTTIVSECKWAELLTEMIDQNAERALTAISETCAEGKYPQLLNKVAQLNPIVFNECMSAAGWIQTADANINALDNFATKEIIEWLTEYRATQFAEYIKARAPQRPSETGWIRADNIGDVLTALDNFSVKEIIKAVTSEEIK